MYAITVQQPWALMIAIGAKGTENRGRNVRYRGPVAIHAGLRWSERGERDAHVQAEWRRFRRTLPPMNVARPRLRRSSVWLNYGAVIAVGQLVDCHPAAGCCQPWGQDTYQRGNGDVVQCHHLVVEDVRRLATPIECRGHQSPLWAPPGDVLTKIREATAHVN